MQKRTFTLLAVGLAAIAAVSPAMAAAPDLMAYLMATFTDPHTAGIAMLAWGPAVRILQQQHAESVDTMSNLANVLGERDLTVDELAKYDSAKANASKLQAKITMAQEAEHAAAGVQRSEPAGVRGQGAIEIPAASTLRVSENVDSDENRGFRSMGDFLGSVRGATVAARQGGRAFDPRLATVMGGGFSAAAPTTWGGESTGEDGGYLVPPGFSADIFRISLEEEALLPLTDGMAIDGNSMTLPKDETTPWGADGVRAYWAGEALVGTQTKPKVGRSNYRLKKLIALVPMTEELLADGAGMGAYFGPACARSIRWKTDEAVMFGAGGEEPLGAYTDSALAISVAKETSQAGATINAQNVTKMLARLMPGCYGNAVWMVNNDALPQLFTMTLGDKPIWMGPNGVTSSPYGTLLGRPLMVTQHAKSIGTVGDIMLADFRQYRSITKAGGIQTATSMHLFFDADAVAFRATFRVDGAPKMSAAITPANGSNTLSPFVQLATRA